MSESNLGKWDAWYKGLDPQKMGAFRFGETPTYQLAADFLAGLALVEDWGCGTGGFKRFCTSPYLGLDGSQTPFADKIVDLVSYRSDADGILLRHVLEHNQEWKTILRNAVASFQKRLCLVIFTPFQQTTREINQNGVHGVDVPDIGFNKEELEKEFGSVPFEFKTLSTKTGYKLEHIYFLTKGAP